MDVDWPASLLRTRNHALIRFAVPDTVLGRVLRAMSLIDLDLNRWHHGSYRPGFAGVLA